MPKLKLSPLQRRAIEELNSGKHRTLGEALRAAGYADNTALEPSGNVLDRPAVRAVLEKQERKLQDIMAEMARRAAIKVQEIMLDPKSTKSEQLQAVTRVQKFLELMSMKLDRDKDMEKLSDEELDARAGQLDLMSRSYTHKMTNLQAKVVENVRHNQQDEASNTPQPDDNKEDKHE